jgi:hypothetical protein
MAAVRTLGVDAMTADVIVALQAAGVQNILMRGPAFGRELYGEGALRTYSDADILVAPDAVPAAARVLESLGFELVLDHREHPGIAEPHAQEWHSQRLRGDVDLHWRIAGVDAPAERAWQILAARTEPLPLAGTVGQAFARPGTALLVALHAAHHGRSRTRALTDLERAVDRLDVGVWREAAALADELEAGEAFAAGLRVIPEGERLADALGLGTVLSPSRQLMASDHQAGAIALLRVVQASSGRDRLRAARVGLFPAPAYMRAKHRLARRGLMGLVLAYLVRMLTHAWQLPGAIRAVRSTRREP